jgi:UDP-N-acetylmuramyl pentapeptide phosphotransferase/UDP-N-acetylglucosamine-1-phosphate transferase
VGIITAASFGGWYFLAGYNQYAILSVSLIGVLFAFSLYNRTPAKIFMGDTGSLIVGLVLSLMAVKFIETSRLLPIDHPNKVRSVPVVTIGILILPLFDTLRVFAIRIMQGKSPFSPDRNHLHHLLLDLGLSHLKATYSLVSVNLLTIAFVFRFHTMKGEILLAILCTFCICASSVLAYAVNKKKKNKFVRFLNPKSELNK